MKTWRSLTWLLKTAAGCQRGCWPGWGMSEFAFSSYRDGNWEIYLADGDTSAQLRLTDHPASDSQPRLNRAPHEWCLPPIGMAIMKFTA